MNDSDVHIFGFFSTSVHRPFVIPYVFFGFFGFFSYFSDFPDFSDFFRTRTDSESRKSAVSPLLGTLPWIPEVERGAQTAARPWHCQSMNRRQCRSRRWHFSARISHLYQLGNYHFFFLCITKEIFSTHHLTEDIWTRPCRIHLGREKRTVQTRELRGSRRPYSTFHVLCCEMVHHRQRTSV